jgi:hypothetical protein
MSYGGASESEGCGEQDALESHVLLYTSLSCCLVLYRLIEQCLCSRCTRGVFLKGEQICQPAVESNETRKEVESMCNELQDLNLLCALLVSAISAHPYPRDPLRKGYPASWSAFGTCQVPYKR